jgi:hypothetical protein
MDLFLNHNLELTESLTISRLALTKFLKYYLKDSKIPLINKLTIFNFCHEGYYGGQTEVYIPYGVNLITLDVNSLYPTVALNPLPGIDCVWIESFDSEGLNLDLLFGIFHAKVVTNHEYFGLLPIKTKNGLIFPKGSFDGV